MNFASEAEISEMGFEKIQSLVYFCVNLALLQRPMIVRFHKMDDNVTAVLSPLAPVCSLK